MVFRRIRTLASGGNSYDEVKLLESARSGTLTIMEIDEALSRKVNINCVWVKSPTIGSADQTILIAYCSSTQTKLQVVKHLLSRGANTNTRARYGHTALSLVTSHPFSTERIEIIRALTKAGAKPSNVNASGETPLHGLARTGSVEEVTYFLKVSPQGLMNYSKRVPDGLGYAPLHCAISAAGGPGQPRLEIIKLLIKTGADINQRTKSLNGQTPLELAKDELRNNEFASARYQEDPDWLERQKKDKREVVNLLQSLREDQSSNIIMP